MHLYILVYKFVIFFTDGVNGVQNLITCFLDFVFGLNSLRSRLFLMYGLVQVIFLSLVFNF